MNKIPMLEKFAAQSLIEHDGELIFSKERFALLIVQECTKVCEKQVAGAVGTYAGAHNNAIGACIKGIREHFGVEQ